MLSGVMAIFLAGSVLPVAAPAQPAPPVPAAPRAGAVETEATFVARCRAETIARFPGARAQAESICRSIWMQIAAASPMADVLIAAAPSAGTSFDPSAARTQLPLVRWAARPAQGSVASGKLGDIEVVIKSTPAPGLTLAWSKGGEPIPFNLAEALKGRGAALATIGCLSFGSSESTQVYRVAAPGKAVFALTIASREAAVASQSSSFIATAAYGGEMPTLATLRRDGSEWFPTCPQ